MQNGGLLGSAQEIDRDLPDRFAPELDVTGADAFVLRAAGLGLVLRDDLLGHDPRLSLGKDPRPWYPDAGHIAVGIDIREARLQRVLVGRDPAVLGHPRIQHHLRGDMERDREDQIGGHGLATLEPDRLAGIFDRGDLRLAHEFDTPFLVRGQEHRANLRGDWQRRRELRDNEDARLLSDAPGDQILVEKEGGFARSRRALVGRRGDRDHGRATGEARDHIPRPDRARHGVELVPVLSQTRCAGGIVIRAQGHHEDIGLVDTSIGGDSLRFGIDRGDRLLAEANPFLDERCIWKADTLRAEFRQT